MRQTPLPPSSKQNACAGHRPSYRLPPASPRSAARGASLTKFWATRAIGPPCATCIFRARSRVCRCSDSRGHLNGRSASTASWRHTSVSRMCAAMGRPSSSSRGAGRPPCRVVGPRRLTSSNSSRRGSRRPSGAPLVPSSAARKRGISRGAGRGRRVGRDSRRLPLTTDVPGRGAFPSATSRLRRLCPCWHARLQGRGLMCGLLDRS